MCGKKFGSLILPALAGILVAGTLTQQQAVRGMICPQCHTQVTTAFECCPHCGQVLRAQKRAKEQTCAYCACAMSMAAQSCPSCGAPVGKRQAQREPG